MVSSFLVVLDFLVCAAVDIGTLGGWASGIVDCGQKVFWPRT
jgi:hypothetical protein